MTISEALLTVIATCCVVMSIWLILMLIAIDKHLLELRISLNELHTRWIDTFEEEEGVAELDQKLASAEKHIDELESVMLTWRGTCEP